jgi:NTP pyrophosphatase (non-canonical NTP hydrolase)
VKSLAVMADEVYEIECLLGWQPNDNRFGESMALLHSEVSEALDAYREHGLDDATTHFGGIDMRTSKPLPPKPEGVGSELADVLIRLLSSARQYGIDLEAEYERKCAYNRTRTYRHGGKKL